MSDETEFEDRYAELRAQYVDRVADRVETIESLVAQLREEFEAETFRRLRELVHRLSGSGETMGYPEISDRSIEIEELLEDVEPADPGEWLGRVDAYCRRLRELVDA